MLPTWVGKLDWEIKENAPLSRIMMDQSWHKVYLVLAQLGFQSFTSSTLPIFFFPQGVNLDSFIPEANCSFLSILKYELYIAIVILMGQKLQKLF